MEKKPTKAEIKEARDRMLRNARHLRELAEKGQAELDRRKQRES
jgi:hypothetical protein